MVQAPTTNPGEPATIAQVAVPETAPAVTPTVVAAPAADVAEVPNPASRSAAKVPAAGLPKVQSFTLPVESLHQVATSSGLAWINSDSAKVAAVQAAIAAEPKPVHVPRERAPRVELDNRPLILVETKRDLRNMTLPFESTSAPSP